MSNRAVEWRTVVKWPLDWHTKETILQVLAFGYLLALAVILVASLLLAL